MAKATMPGQPQRWKKETSCIAVVGSEEHADFREVTFKAVTANCRFEVTRVMAPVAGATPSTPVPGST